MDWRALPERPASEVEWEELLVKLDIAPRALRMAADDAPPGERRARTLARAARREAWIADCPARSRARQALSLEADFEVPGADADGAALEAVDRYARLRERNFSQLQRRGLEVWGWRSAEPDGITAYQFAQLMAHWDQDALRTLRAIGAPV